MTIRRCAAAALLLWLSGCASLAPGPSAPTAQPPSAPASRYVPEPGRDAQTVAEMRAAPPPATPELIPGKNPAAEQRRQVAHGYVRVGNAHLAGDEATVRDEAIREGQAAGADRVLLYAPEAAGGEWLAAYYVRFQLPFGATFRDLTAEERATSGSDGGVAIGSIVAGTPASRANLLGGDLVLKFDGQPFAGRAAFQNLLRARAGRAVTLTILRNGETLERVVRLGAMPSATR
jgi:membrane-associated protease RseP (regulator of RpoE activity)